MRQLVAAWLRHQAGGISFWPQPTANAESARTFPGNLSEAERERVGEKGEGEETLLAEPLEASTDQCGIMRGAAYQHSLSSFLRRNASRGGGGAGVAMVA